MIADLDSPLVIDPEEFEYRLHELKDEIKVKYGCVTGPGRSGAIASAMASHVLGVPFIPFRTPVPEKLRPVLVIDTARMTGKTMRKARKMYGASAVQAWLFDEPPIVRFWYERIGKHAQGT